MSYEYRAQMMNGTIKDAKDNYENAKGNAEKEKYEIEIQRLQSLQNAYKTAGDYEAKAKAFDQVVEERNQAGTDMYGKDDDVVDRVIERAFWNIDGIIVEYESGESDAKK